VLFAKHEGILPAPEANHAVKGAIEEALKAKAAGTAPVILFNLCGHGHFDMAAYEKFNAGEMVDSEFSDQVAPLPNFHAPHEAPRLVREKRHPPPRSPRAPPHRTPPSVATAAPQRLPPSCAEARALRACTGAAFPGPGRAPRGPRGPLPDCKATDLRARRGRIWPWRLRPSPTCRSPLRRAESRVARGHGCLAARRLRGCGRALETAFVEVFQRMKLYTSGLTRRRLTRQRQASACKSLVPVKIPFFSAS
jgi:hypothetical protein